MMNGIGDDHLQDLGAGPVQCQKKSAGLDRGMWTMGRRDANHQSDKYAVHASLLFLMRPLIKFSHSVCLSLVAMLISSFATMMVGPYAECGFLREEVSSTCMGGGED